MRTNVRMMIGLMVATASGPARAQDESTPEELKVILFDGADKGEASCGDKKEIFRNASADEERVSFTFANNCKGTAIQVLISNPEGTGMGRQECGVNPDEGGSCSVKVPAHASVWVAPKTKSEGTWTYEKH